MNNPKSHFYLVSAEITFRNGNGEGVDSLGQHRLNSTIENDNPTVPARLIGRAQQAAQMLFFDRIDRDPDIQVVDVCIFAISYLGEMTKEDFLAPPEGMVQQEAPAEALLSPAAPSRSH